MARVLVIEDNRDNLELMQYLLRAFGHETTSAEDGAGGVAAALRDRPDLVLCDIHLPGSDGFDVLNRLKAEKALRQMPVVAVTAMAMIGDSERGLAAGFDGYIYKPIDPETFASQLAAFLPHRAVGRSAAAPAAGNEPSAVPTGLAPRSRASVLVVDDSADNCAFIEQTLTPFGYRVSVASSAGAGFTRARAARPDLILTDLHMPDSDGLRLIRDLKAEPELADVPIVVITSSTWGATQRHASMQLGATRFLLRPIEPQDLLRELKACLDEANGGADGDRSGR